MGRSAASCHAACCHAAGLLLTYLICCPAPAFCMYTCICVAWHEPGRGRPLRAGPALSAGWPNGPPARGRYAGYITYADAFASTWWYLD